MCLFATLEHNREVRRYDFPRENRLGIKYALASDSSSIYTYRYRYKYYGISMIYEIDLKYYRDLADYMEIQNCDRIKIHIGMTSSARWQTRIYKSKRLMTSLVYVYTLYSTINMNA